MKKGHRSLATFASAAFLFSNEGRANLLPADYLNVANDKKTVPNWPMEMPFFLGATIFAKAKKGYIILKI